MKFVTVSSIFRALCHSLAIPYPMPHVKFLDFLPVCLYWRFCMSVFLHFFRMYTLALHKVSRFHLVWRPILLHFYGSIGSKIPLPGVLGV